MYERIDTIRAADKWEISRLAAARMRARFLFQRIDEWLENGSDLALYWVQQAFDELDELARRCRIPPRDPSKALTQEQIQQAREYPIDKLVEFNRTGKAYAWCHNDHVPSLHHNRKHNRAHCWPCNHSYNPIDVLVYRDGRSFEEAVRSLL